MLLKESQSVLALLVYQYLDSFVEIILERHIFYFSKLFKSAAPTWSPF